VNRKSRDGIAWQPRPARFSSTAPLHRGWVGRANYQSNGAVRSPTSRWHAEYPGFAYQRREARGSNLTAGLLPLFYTTALTLTLAFFTTPSQAEVITYAPSSNMHYTRRGDLDGRPS
jgi:hypothetical protein